MKRQVKRTFYKDKWNQNKFWEVAELVGGYYLRQYVCGKQWGNGMRTTKQFIKTIGIFDFEQIPGIQ
ncbi:MAG TPA: hypothetical protein DEB74_07475 [Lachnospiraceae bacterium]|nr:hypothetical protein [Lachnospiraceae bacterium]